MPGLLLLGTCAKTRRGCEPVRCHHMEIAEFAVYLHRGTCPAIGASTFYYNARTRTCPLISEQKQMIILRELLGWRTDENETIKSSYLPSRRSSGTSLQTLPQCIGCQRKFAAIEFQNLQQTGHNIVWNVDYVKCPDCGKEVQGRRRQRLFLCCDVKLFRMMVCIKIVDD